MASSVVRSIDPAACVASWFPAKTFASDADLAFVCVESNATRGSGKLRRTIIAGAGGRAVTPAMNEYVRYHWFELPVYATLRASCCAPAALEIPPALKCASPAPAIEALAAAAAAHASLDEPVRAYRKIIECLVGRGEQSLYGETEGVRGGQETAFRAFAARGER